MNFHNYFRTDRAEFLGLFSSSLGLGLSFVLIPGLMSLGFMVCFRITVIL